MQFAYEAINGLFNLRNNKEHYY